MLGQICVPRLAETGGLGGLGITLAEQDTGECVDLGELDGEALGGNRRVVPTLGLEGSFIQPKAEACETNASFDIKF